MQCALEVRFAPIIKEQLCCIQFCVPANIPEAIPTPAGEAIQLNEPPTITLLAPVATLVFPPTTILKAAEPVFLHPPPIKEQFPLTKLK